MLSINDPAVWLKDLFTQAGLSYSQASFLSTVALVLIVMLLSWLSNIIAKVLIGRVVTRIVKRTESEWDDIFLEQKVFTRLSHLAPALVIWFMTGWALKAYPLWLIAIHKLTYIYMVVIGMVVINSFIEAWHKIYNTLPISQHRHIKGYVQLVKIFVILVAILIVISVVFKKDISSLLTGIGAMAAVLILVFKDTLLGLVASIQLSANKMLSIGDWISIPSKEVDGLVIDITLNTVKVQNFDKTIITIPTYSLVNDAFQNWKGMEESGIRQIKRAFFIDIRSIKFPDRKLKDKLKSIPGLTEYINTFESDNSEPDKSSDSSDSPFLNPSRITNLGIFRFYAEQYLKKHKYIDDKQPVVVRHRAPESNGLPIQIYAFARSNQFSPYENVQSEIFEHLIAVLSEFELRISQQPTGEDLLGISIQKHN
jgi:miniconductance mechanosensitive channel